MQECEVAAAEQNTAAVLHEYAHLERCGTISAQHRASLRQRAGPCAEGGGGQPHSPRSFLDSAGAAAHPVQLFPAF
jgi:hypothetical protein